MKKGIIMGLFLSVLAFSVHASQKPIHLSSDNRIEVVAYSPYNVVPVNGTTFTTTQVVFGKNEYIENIQNGDLGAWTASVSKSLPNMMFIKPTAFGSDTNMTVVTNKRTYYFHLQSNKEGQADQKTATYAIHFVYPEEQKKKIESAIAQRERDKETEISAFKNPSKFNWDYSFNGDTSIVPMHVFDDGKFTYMQLQSGQAMPAVFAVTSTSGKEAVVNYRRDGDYLIIERIAPQFTLRLGASHVASIFNMKAITRIRGKSWF